MGKILLICGKICSGKSYYVRQLKQKVNAVVFSCDEILFDVSLESLADKHNEIVNKLKQYFYKKSEEIIMCGIDVILDFGFWSKEERNIVELYFSEHNIPFEWHYVDVSDADWKKNIEERNALILKSKVNAFYVDEGLKMKLEKSFEKPLKHEIDVWITNKRSVMSVSTE